LGASGSLVLDFDLALLSHDLLRVESHDFLELILMTSSVVAGGDLGRENEIFFAISIGENLPDLPNFVSMTSYPCCSFEAGRSGPMYLIKVSSINGWPDSFASILQISATFLCMAVTPFIAAS